MKTSIKIIRLNNLKAHEDVSLSRCKAVLAMLKQSGSFTKPVVIDRKTKTILDGHHRISVLKSLKYAKVPALLVNYSSKLITVNSRRKKYKVNKKIVLAKALQCQLFPYKTTKHAWQSPLPDININLNQLK